MAYQFGPAHSFKQDLLGIARADLAAGRLQRRDFLKLCLWAGGTTSLAWLNGLTASEAAQAKQIIVANFGGPSYARDGGSVGRTVH